MTQVAYFLLRPFSLYNNFSLAYRFTRKYGKLWKSSDVSVVRNDGGYTKVSIIQS